MTEFDNFLLTTFAEVNLVKRTMQRIMSFCDPQKGSTRPKNSKFISLVANDKSRNLLECSVRNKISRFLPASKQCLQACRVDRSLYRYAVTWVRYVPPLLTPQVCCPGIVARSYYAGHFRIFRMGSVSYQWVPVL